MDLVITDPPFNVGISYGVGISDHLTEKQYQAFTCRWLTEALRVLKPRGQLYAIMPKHLAKRVCEKMYQPGLRRRSMR